MVQIAVLITCHNRKDKTLQCLTLLYEQNGLDHDYILKTYLVDDGSSDGTALAVKKAFPQIKVIKGNGNLYWNRGMHTAWEKASEGKYDYYLWVNDDTNLYRNALADMLEAAKQTNSKSIICGSISSTLNKKELVYGGGNMKGRTCVLNYPDGNIKQCEKINGNCVLIPLFVFNLVGNLDWTFTHAMGDNDYSLRAKKLGVLSYTTGAFVASCDQHESLPKWCLPNIDLLNRLKNLYSPLSYSHPHEFFIFEYRHFGLYTAMKHYFSIHLRVFFPKLWE